MLFNLRHVSLAYILKWWSLTRGKHNIVRMLQWREFETTIEIDLQLCSRGNLYSVMSELRKDGTLALSFLHQTASGLHYLHLNEIIHRDIKPGNILVHQRDSRDSLCFKVADFGLSNNIERAETVCGTGVYMAPELFERKAKQTFKIDIFALGVVLVEIFRGFNHIDNKAWQPQVWMKMLDRKASTLGNNVDADFVRRMILIDEASRPSALQCLKYSPGKALCKAPVTASVDQQQFRPRRLRNDWVRRNATLYPKEGSPQLRYELRQRKGLDRTSTYQQSIPVMRGRCRDPINLRETASRRRDFKKTRRVKIHGAWPESTCRESRLVAKA